MNKWNALNACFRHIAFKWDSDKPLNAAWMIALMSLAEDAERENMTVEQIHDEMDARL